jgi:hypothetical protein
VQHRRSALLLLEGEQFWSRQRAAFLPPFTVQVEDRLLVADVAGSNHCAINFDEERAGTIHQIDHQVLRS